MRLLLFFVLLSTFGYSQSKKCEYDFEIHNDSISYKEGKKHLIYELSIGKKSNYLFLNFVNDSGIPILNIQKVQKSDQFIETECFDKNSRIFLQLTNGKIYTLVHADQEVCSVLYPDSELNIRVANTSFYFLKDDFTDLKTYPISILQIRYGMGDKTSYVMESKFTSKIFDVVTYPSRLFIDHFSCFE